jgi:hypothetical protein
MKAICASVNFDFFMPKTPSAARAAKLEFSRNERSRKPEAGQRKFRVSGQALSGVPVFCLPDI